MGGIVKVMFDTYKDMIGGTSDADWTPVNLPPRARAVGLKVDYIKDGEEFKLRAGFIAPLSPDEVFERVNLGYHIDKKQSESPIYWNTRVQKVKRMANFNDSCDLVHHMYKAFNWERRFLDLCLLKVVSHDAAGHWICLNSVVHPNCPEHPDRETVRRARVKPSGWFIT